MFSCLQILEAFLWFDLITLLNVTMVILSLSGSRLLSMLFRITAFVLLFNCQSLASLLSRINASISWAGCLVHIHEVVEKTGREVFRCSLSGQASGRWLEIPDWMFDRAAGAAWRVGAAPYVDIAVLTALATLLQDVTSVSSAPSQLRDSSAALGSHDANRGDVHAAPAYRSPPSSQQCTSVRSVLRPAHRRGADAAMAGVARRDAPYADEADGPPDLRPRRRRPRSGTAGDAS